VNLDQWKKLSPQHQAAIEKLAKELQPQFWEIAKAEDAKASAVLRQNGMSVEMADAAMVKDMRAAALPMWDEFATRVGGSIPAALKEYRAKTGK
jgi:TRAP-type C4-dicarboxylate transport system substrate-binding protein